MQCSSSTRPDRSAMPLSRSKGPTEPHPLLVSFFVKLAGSDGWEDPMGAPDLDPWRGCVEEDWREFVEEDCSQAFDDVAF